MAALLTFPAASTRSTGAAISARRSLVRGCALMTVISNFIGRSCESDGGIITPSDSQLRPMKFDITVINAHPRTRLRRAEIAAPVERVLAAGKVRSAAINVILVDDDELLRMNREHLQHDYYTDVITFLLEEKPLEGEIYISVDRARE